MVGDFDTPRYFQRSSICCEVLFQAKAIHWKAALGILAYINGTSGFGITYQRGTLASISLEVFADANYASKAIDRRSGSGGAIMYGGACVCWFFRTQKCVTRSTSEAEYVALGDAVCFVVPKLKGICEMVWMGRAIYPC